MVAACHGHASAIRLLVQYGASVNAQAGMGAPRRPFGASLVRCTHLRGDAPCGSNTALHVAASCGNVDAMDALLEAGAHWGIKDINGYTIHAFEPFGTEAVAACSKTAEALADETGQEHLYIEADNKVRPPLTADASVRGDRCCIAMLQRSPLHHSVSRCN